MTPLHLALQRHGYTDCRTVGGRTAALRQVDGGTALRTGLQIDAEGVTWRVQNTFRYDDRHMVDSAKAALSAWELLQRSAESVGMTE